MKHRCGECDSVLLAVGRLLFCPKKSCSMYDRAVDVREAETEDERPQARVA